MNTEQADPNYEFPYPPETDVVKLIGKSLKKTLDRINVTPKELSRMALDKIKANKDRWNQRVWHLVEAWRDVEEVTIDGISVIKPKENSGHTCQTSHCYAGWLDQVISEVVLSNTSSGTELDFEYRQVDEILKEDFEKELLDKTDWVEGKCNYTDLRLGLVNDVIGVMGFTSEQWYCLTHTTNSFNDLVEHHNRCFQDNYPLEENNF